MHRRAATLFLTSLVLAGCGGGGGGSGTQEQNAQAAAPPTTTSIALWGDSMLPPVGRALRLAEPARQVHDGAVAGETSMQMAARQARDTEHRDWITIFWVGHNNMRLDPASASAQIKADLASSIARLAPGNDRFLILSVVNNAQTPRGTPTYDRIIQLNDELAATYGSNFVDMRSFMVEQADRANAQQLAEYNADLPSSALRFDEIHLTGYGAEVVARRLLEELEARGW